MPELRLKQPDFTYSVCGPFTKNKERIKKFMQTGNTDFIYKNELRKIWPMVKQKIQLEEFSQIKY